MGASGEQPPGSYVPAGRETVRAQLPLGATQPLDDMRYPQLYEHSQQLGRLAEWDGRGVFAGAGVLVLGAGIGALVAGTSIAKAGVLLCLVSGALLLVASLFIKRASIASARNLKISFDQNLSLYEVQNEEIRAMKEHLDAQLLPQPRSRWERVRRFFNF
jgi:hypothetical protein